MSSHHPLRQSLLLLPLLLLTSSSVTAQAGAVRSELKISRTSGGFSGALSPGDTFGRSLAPLGDLDGDGIDDLVVGASRDDDGGPDRGALWVLFLRSDGTVRTHQKISDTAGGFTGTLRHGDLFGVSVDGLGDLDSDGVIDLAVGAWADDDGGSGRGAVWILFLNSDGTVKTHQKISQTSGGFGGTLSNFDGLGYSLDEIGDLDGDGVVELAVGAMYDDDGGPGRGAVWILFLNSDGTVKSEQKISQTSGGFGGSLADDDSFGVSVTTLGDLDGDGTVDLGCGANRTDEGGTDRGAMWLLFLQSNGTVKSQRRLSSSSPGLTGALDDGDAFGLAACSVGDLDGDGRRELAVTLGGDSDGGYRRGAILVLFLRPDGTVRARQKISDLEGGFSGVLDDEDMFGRKIDWIGDRNGDGFPDLAAGAIGDDDGGANCGALWILQLQGCPAAEAVSRNPDLGGGANPPHYSVTSLPTMGGTFTASIPCAGMSGALLFGYAHPASIPSGWGNILVDFVAGPELLGMPGGIGDPTIVQILVPDDPIVCGWTLATQALRFGPSGYDLTNARDLVLGR